MKRYLTLFLAVLVLVSIFAIPVAADDYATWYSIFDYSIRSDVDEANSRFVNLITASYNANWSFPSPMMVSSLDMVIFVKYGSLSSIVHSNQRFNIEQIGTTSQGNYYRAHLDLTYPGAKENLSIWFDGTIGTQVYIESFNASTVYLDRVDLSGNGAFYNGSTSAQFTYPGAITKSVVVTETEDTPAHILMHLEPNLYDYVDLIFTVRNFNITGVSCYVGDVILPVELSPLNGNDSDHSYTTFNVKVDFTEYAKDLSATCALYISGYVPSFVEAENVSVQLTVHQATGYILGYETDPGAYWMKMIWWDMRGWFGTLTDNMINYINDFRTDMVNHFNNLSGTLGGLFDGLKANLNSNFDDLIDVLSPDETPADNLQSEIDDQAGQLGEITGALDSMERPDLNDVSGDISGYVDTFYVQYAGTPLRNILIHPFFTNLFMIALILMLASYVLYGKR